MKLEQLFENHKLDEVKLLQGTLDHHFVNDEAFDKSGKHLGDIDGYKIVLYKSPQKGVVKIALRDHQTQLGFIVGMFFKHGHSSTAFFKISRTWAEPVIRGQGLVTKIMDYIKSKWNIIFMSDSELTTDGLGLWKRLAQTQTVQILDVVDNTKIDWTPNTQQQLFVRQQDYTKASSIEKGILDKQIQRYYLIAEMQDLPNAHGIPNTSLCNPITEEMVL